MESKSGKRIYVIWNKARRRAFITLTRPAVGEIGYLDMPGGIANASVWMSCGAVYTTVETSLAETDSETRRDVLRLVSDITYAFLTSIDNYILSVSPYLLFYCDDEYIQCSASGHIAHIAPNASYGGLA